VVFFILFISVSAVPRITGNLLEFEILPGNSGNLDLVEIWFSGKLLARLME